ncbi:MAG: DUF2442 domain-containing protein [Verrucomicrobia bacterium]|nr:DUF2442 domain-containing protein [Verrucomicrobiota bacterium]
MKSVPQVIRCAVVGATSVRVKFSDGFAGTLDLLPALRGRVFAALKRAEKFREVAVQDGTLVWPGGADICPSVLRYWCELGRVCSQEELDAHFSVAASAEMVGMVAESPVKCGKPR